MIYVPLISHDLFPLLRPSTCARFVGGMAAAGVHGNVKIHCFLIFYLSVADRAPLVRINELTLMINLSYLSLDQTLF